MLCFYLILPYFTIKKLKIKFVIGVDKMWYEMMVKVVVGFINNKYFALYNIK